MCQPCSRFRNGEKEINDALNFLFHSRLNLDLLSYALQLFRLYNTDVQLWYEILSRDQLCQCRAKNQRFGDSLYFC